MHVAKQEHNLCIVIQQTVAPALGVLHHFSLVPCAQNSGMQYLLYKAKSGRHFFSPNGPWKCYSMVYVGVACWGSWGSPSLAPGAFSNLCGLRPQSNDLNFDLFGGFGGKRTCVWVFEMTLVLLLLQTDQRIKRSRSPAQRTVCDCVFQLIWIPFLVVLVQIQGRADIVAPQYCAILNNIPFCRESQHWAIIGTHGNMTTFSPAKFFRRSPKAMRVLHANANLKYQIDLQYVLRLK